MVARFLPPSPSFDCLYLPDCPVPCHAAISPPARPNSSSWRNNHTRTPGSGRLVNGSSILRPFSHGRVNLSQYLLDDRNFCGLAVDIAACQNLRDDPTTGTHTKMELLPATAPATAMPNGSPLAFAHDRKASTVKDQSIAPRPCFETKEAPDAALRRDSVV